MRNKERQVAAQKAADYIMGIEKVKKILFGGKTGERTVATTDAGNIGLNLIKAAVVLGTGWGDVLMSKIQTERNISIPLEEIPGFEFLKQMQQIEGHKRELIISTLGDDVIVALSGRLHMNESHDSDELAKVVRLQVEMLMELGVKNLILTNAAGSLRPEIKVGDVVSHNGFITLFAPPLPLWGGEFISPEDMLKEESILKIRNAAHKAGLTCCRGAGAMVRGPFFEGRKHDKKILREFGASMAMMSVLPETAVAALYSDVNVYAMSFITNTASEEHSHEENQERAKKSSQKLGNLLLSLIESIE